jgi:glyoxylase-like metal-dependent hydrolase (beta-lactamase superfamily II)
MDPVELDKRAKGKPFNFADTVHPLPLGFHRIKEGDEITMGKLTWDIRIGNGHAPEHATFWCRDDDIVISGDQIISAISPNLGVYATEPEADPVGEWLEACERLSQHAKQTHVVLSGHKLPFLGLPHRMQHLIDNHHHALDRLVEYIETPKCATDCFPALFKRKIGEGEYGLALVESVAHLNHLYVAGRAKRVLNENGAYLYCAI